jgi:hypothetical protein
VAYFFRKHFPAKINYKIYNKEYLAIIWAFKVSHRLLEGSPHTHEVTSDYQNLTYFPTKRLLN